MRRWFLLAASLIVSGVFLWLALRGVPLTDVLGGIRQANLIWVLLSFVCVVGSLIARAIRWRGLLDNRVPLMQAFHILNVTMLLNQLPLRAGEVARTLLATRSGVPIVTAATSIVVERLLDVVIVVIMLAIALARLPSAPAAITQAAEAFGALALIAFVAIMVFARYPQVADRVLIWLEQRVPALRRLNLRRRVDEVLDGIRPLTDAGRAVHAIGWSLVCWLMPLITFYALERALSISGIDLWEAALLGVTLASFSIAIPVSLASIGPFEGAVRVAGDAVQMSALAATTLGFLYHGAAVITYAVLGGIGLIVLGVSLGDVLEPTTEKSVTV
ncbi:MAG TPA: lysylphosphatidylglycerol synthase transmembrane domain-containing protein [Phototrophicaceae bacterium]|nr:lysylphosphatidylglycerol synthase transmembrane domain-containing protein [Phototrophicaceae bacterium]